jgi:type VI secretion system secreted protein VgrG
MPILTEIDILINQKPFKKFHRVSINQNLYSIDTFEITCRYDALEELDSFLIEKSKNYLGLPVVIQTKIKIKDEDKDGITFRGFVTGIQSSRSGMTDYDEVIISGGSSEIALDRKPHNRAFLDKTLEEIVKEVFKKYEFSSKVSPRNKERFPYIAQFEESDLEFVKRLSIRYGEWCFFNGQEFIFGEMPVVEKSLTIGYDLKDFKYGLRVSPVKFDLHCVDSLQPEVYRYKSGNSKIESNLNMYGKHALKMSKKMYTERGTDYYEHLNVPETDCQKGLNLVGELEETADAVRLTELSGTSTNGFLNPGVQAKVTCIKQDRKGKMDYGKYLITSVIHEMDSNLDYENNFAAIPAETSIPEDTDPYFVRTSSNQLGMVMDNKDPEKIGRVKISFWWMQTKQTTPWIKIAHPYTGKEYGFYFVPAVNTQVLVGFEDGDVEKPYCMGFLYNKNGKPDPAWVGNRDKDFAKIHAIRTSTGNTIEFHDSDGGEKITIYDSNDKNRITLDSTNGTLTIHSDGTLNLDASKINLKAEQEINFSCKKNIAIDAKGNLELKSNGETSMSTIKDLKITGDNVSLGAMSKIKATASASAEINAVGNTVIKGAVVQIN